VGGVRLCDRFPRLYNLDRKKEGMVVAEWNWVDGAWCWKDRWRWTLHKSGDFTVKELTKWWKRRS
ncbi:hypothetical protein Tco_0948307, partial [Tanacetum coccineum]